MLSHHPRLNPAVSRAAELAEREVASAEGNHRAILAIYRGACARLGKANALKAHPEVRRREQRDAMAWINSRRAMMRKATARLDAARAALAALAH